MSFFLFPYGPHIYTYTSHHTHTVQVLFDEYPLVLLLENAEVKAVVYPRADSEVSDTLLDLSLPVTPYTHCTVTLSMDMDAARLTLNGQQTDFFFPVLEPTFLEARGQKDRGPFLFGAFEGPAYIGNSVYPFP